MVHNKAHSSLKNVLIPPRWDQTAETNIIVIIKGHADFLMMVYDYEHYHWDSGPMRIQEIPLVYKASRSSSKPLTCEYPLEDCWTRHVGGSHCLPEKLTSKDVLIQEVSHPKSGIHLLAQTSSGNSSRKWKDWSPYSSKH